MRDKSLCYASMPAVAEATAASACLAALPVCVSV